MDVPHFRTCASVRILACVLLLGIALAGCIPFEDPGECWTKGKMDPALEGHWKKVGTQNKERDEYMSFINRGDYYGVRDTSANLPDLDSDVGDNWARTLTIGNSAFLIVNVQDRLRAEYKLLKELKELARIESSGSNPEAEENARKADEVDTMIQALAGIESSDATQEVSEIPRMWYSYLEKYAIQDGKLITYDLESTATLDDAVRSGKVKGSVNECIREELPRAVLAKLDDETMRYIASIADEPSYWKETATYERVADLDEALKISRSYPATEATPGNTEVVIDLPDLEYFAHAGADVLKRQLEASPDWEVSRQGTVTVASLARNLSWMPTNGFFTDDRENIEAAAKAGATPVAGSPSQVVTCQFRFDEKSSAEGITHTMSKFTFAGPRAGSIHVDLRSSEGRIHSQPVVGTAGLWLEIYEQTAYERRVLTREALEWVRSFLHSVHESETEIVCNGYAAALTPRDSIRRGPWSFEVDGGDGPGRMVHTDGWTNSIQAGAWINPGEQGNAYLSVRGIGGEAANSFNESSACCKCVGWSADPNTLFSYGASVEIPYDSAVPEKYIVELWFKPDTGAARKLAESTVTVRRAESGAPRAAMGED